MSKAKLETEPEPTGKVEEGVWAQPLAMFAPYPLDELMDETREVRVVCTPSGDPLAQTWTATKRGDTVGSIETSGATISAELKLTAAGADLAARHRPTLSTQNYV